MRIEGGDHLESYSPVVSAINIILSLTIDLMLLINWGTCLPKDCLMLCLNILCLNIFE